MARRKQKPSEEWRYLSRLCRRNDHVACPGTYGVVNKPRRCECTCHEPKERDMETQKAIGFEGMRRFILEEVGFGRRHLWFFTCSGKELVDVIAAVEVYNRFEHFVQRGEDGTAKIYIAAEYLRAYGFTEEEENAYIQAIIERDDNVAIDFEETLSPVTVAQDLASWKERLS